MESRGSRRKGWFGRGKKRKIHKQEHTNLNLEVLRRPEKKPSVWFVGLLAYVFLGLVIGTGVYFTKGDVLENASLSRWVGIQMFTGDEAGAGEQAKTRGARSSGIDVMNEASAEEKGSGEGSSELKRVILTDPKTGLPLRKKDVHN